MDKVQSLVIGLPRGMLFYRYETLWREFFAQLGAKVVVSPPTNRKMMEQGANLAVDETCLSAKIFFGHVQALMGQCDYILVPRISSTGLKKTMCTRFQGLYDQTVNVFRGSEQKFLAYNMDVQQESTRKMGFSELGRLVGLNGDMAAPEVRDEKLAFLEMGESLGFASKDVKRAYNRAKKAELKKRRADAAATEQLYKAEGTKILIVGHSYVIQDAYIGKTITDFLKKSDVTPIRADLVDREEAVRRSVELSKTCKWEVSRELLGSIVMHKDKVDGIILLSAFPCGPDSMVNELITRKVKDVPMLNLVLDSQSGTAGIETRLESFVDIIRFKEGTL
jgi:predicted nucleotide-binding protein (sugar kinase/HSP70/actin superfamily)